MHTQQSHLDKSCAKQVDRFTRCKTKKQPFEYKAEASVTHLLYFVPGNAADASVELKMLAPCQQRVKGVKLRAVTHVLVYLHHILLDAAQEIMTN